MTARAVVTLVTLLVGVACQMPGSRSGCDNVAIDWVNFIEVGSTQYVSGTVPTADLQAADLGPVYAHVKFKLSGNVCDPNYRPKDGDAAFLDPGTPIYEIKDEPPSEHLAARMNGDILIYQAIVKGPLPVAGTPSP